MSAVYYFYFGSDTSEDQHSAANDDHESGDTYFNDSSDEGEGVLDVESSDSDIELVSDNDMSSNFYDDQSESELTVNNKQLHVYKDQMTFIEHITSTISLFLSLFQLKYKVPDRGITMLLCFVRYLISMIAAFFPGQEVFRTLVNIIPKTCYHFRAKLGNIVKETQKEFVVCPSCDALYNYSVCIIRTGQKTESKKCHYIAFPNHHKNRRQRCNTILMKTVKYGSTYKLVPKKVFLYNSVYERIKELLSDSFFREKVNWQANASFQQGILTDIIDGRIWQEFRVHSGMPFLDISCNLALLLNINWFQPFEHATYSVGGNLSCNSKFTP